MQVLLREIGAVSLAFVAILFLYAGVTKLLSLAAFRRDLLLVPYLPRELSRSLAIAIPVAEVVTGSCLILSMAWAKIAAIAMFAAFSAVALLAQSRDQKVPCNCFGIDSSEHLSMTTVARNALLACLVAASSFFAASQSPPLAQSYGLIAFVLFLSVNAAMRNGHELREALNSRELA